MSSLFFQVGAIVPHLFLERGNVRWQMSGDKCPTFTYFYVLATKYAYIHLKEYSYFYIF